jgi:inhibitor of KinA
LSIVEGVVPSYEPLGEQAVLVAFGTSFDPAIHAGIVKLAKRLRTFPFPGFVECVPSYTTICIYFDVEAVADNEGGTIKKSIFETVCARVAERWMDNGGDVGDMLPKTVRIPVCYCPLCGPDLEEVAAVTGSAAADVAALHASVPYRVSMIGFQPGFPYMTGLPERLWLPRLASPRTRVPAGSVAIADKQSGVYPLSSPGGWRLLGRTSARLFRPEEMRTPSLLEAGDTVYFFAVSHEQLEEGMRDGIPRA